MLNLNNDSLKKMGNAKGRALGILREVLQAEGLRYSKRKMFEFTSNVYLIYCSLYRRPSRLTANIRYSLFGDLFHLCYFS